MSDSQAAIQQRWSEYAELLDHAMQQPAVSAIPEVMDVLVLLGAGVLQLASEMKALRENGREDQSNLQLEYDIVPPRQTPKNVRTVTAKVVRSGS
jgi:uncharacterized protein YoaH (UPF0181 family)